MQAIRITRYGRPELTSVDLPVPKDDEVLVRVHAASVNPLDWHSMTGTPYLMRFQFGLRTPKEHALGTDVAGVVESVGTAVTRFRPGDAVFGARTGAFAEHVCVREAGILVPKPDTVTFEDAAAVPVAALTALQALRDRGGVRPGHRVLVIGASGGVGTYAVQLAKIFGAEVTAVCSTRNLSLVRSIGADHVIDYTNTDFAAQSQTYDVILDNIGTRSIADRRCVLAPGGILVTVGGPRRTGCWVRCRR